MAPVTAVFQSRWATAPLGIIEELIDDRLPSAPPHCQSCCPPGPARLLLAGRSTANAAAVGPMSVAAEITATSMVRKRFEERDIANLRGRELLLYARWASRRSDMELYSLEQLS